MKKTLIIATTILISCGPPPPPQYGAPGAEAVGPNGRPAWVDGRSTRYPELMFLTGVGHGPGQAQCENDAYAALAKIFNAQIHQVSQDWQQYFTQVQSMGPSIKMEAMSLSQLTQVSTDKVVKGARISEHWDGDGTHHCLATLERDPAARNLQEEISRLDAEIRAKVDLGDKEATPTAKFMAYARAMELLQEREVLNIDLRIVSSRGGGVPSPVDFPSLVAKFTVSKRQIKVGLKITGQSADKIQTCLAEELSKRDIQVLEGSSDVDLMIHGTLKYQKAGNVAGSEMVRANINLRVTDIGDGRTLSAFTEDVKVGRPELEQSVQLAVSKLCSQAAPSLVAKVKAALTK
jgi:hypothetical protein